MLLSMVSYTLCFVSVHQTNFASSQLRSYCVASRSSHYPALRKETSLKPRALLCMNSNVAEDDDLVYGSNSLNEIQLECVSDTLQSSRNSNTAIGESQSAMDPELLSEYLMETGALSVVIEDADKGTEDEQPIFNQPSDDGESWYRLGAVQDNFWRRQPHASL